jgi:UTP--glucose-1-phosphate uridylyltransferase
LLYSLIANNIWMNLKAIKRVLDNDELDLEIIVNNKVTPNGESVIQLETAIGAAIKHFRSVKKDATFWGVRG